MREKHAKEQASQVVTAISFEIYSRKIGQIEQDPR
jgi:hypothetical protein